MNEPQEAAALGFIASEEGVLETDAASETDGMVLLFIRVGAGVEVRK